MEAIGIFIIFISLFIIEYAKKNMLIFSNTKYCRKYENIFDVALIFAFLGVFLSTIETAIKIFFKFI
jgi:hypothetical protein